MNTPSLKLVKSALGDQKAFSLIEVVLALGVISFAMVALVGLLPVGLGTQRQAASQAHCIQSLSELSQAASTIYSTTNGGLLFPTPMNINNNEMQPGTPAVKTYFLAGNGKLTNSAASDIRGAVYIRQYPRTTSNLIPIYISIAWPASATYVSDSWQKAQGSVENMIYVSPQ